MKSSSLKKFTAAAALAGFLAVGGTAVAGAATSDKPATERPAICDRVPVLQDRIVAVHERAHDRLRQARRRPGQGGGRR